MHINTLTALVVFATLSAPAGAQVDPHKQKSYSRQDPFWGHYLAGCACSKGHKNPKQRWNGLESLIENCKEKIKS